MTDDHQPDDENVTEFVMQKNGSYVEIWAVVNGQQIFRAAPPVTHAGGVIQAAVKTFLTRGWEQELTELVAEEDESKGGWFQ